MFERHNIIDCGYCVNIVIPQVFHAIQGSRGAIQGFGAALLETSAD